MKASLLPALLAIAVLSCPASSVESQLTDDVAKLKVKYRDQKAQLAPAVLSAASQAGAPRTAPGYPQIPEKSIAELEKLLLRLPDCKTNPKDTANLAAGLRGKYGLVTCRMPGEGLSAFVLVPKAVRPEQQLMYAAPPGLTFLDARFFDHYVVLQFDTQVHYLDLLKPSSNGFALGGYLAGDTLDKFEDEGILSDALKTYRGVKGNSDLLAKLPALVAKAAAGEKYRIMALERQGGWYVVVTTKAGATRVWPETKSP